LAFLTENQLWLQATLAELRDDTTIIQQRDSLLAGLADLLREVAPARYAPGGGSGQGESDFRFGAEPPQGIVLAASQVQRESYEGSVAQEFIRLWHERAQFMLLLSRMTSNVKLDNYSRRTSCELCGTTQQLVVTPIYTLLHLASSYRMQRDMSPLWNTALWQHFYQTFTPTCTICDKCADTYYRMNANIPVDEGRFQKLQSRKKTIHEGLMESELPVQPLDSGAIDILHYWLAWMKDLVNDENPRDFLPRYGVEGRSMQEMRREQQARDQAADADGEVLPDVISSEEEAGEETRTLEEVEAEEEAKKNRRVIRPVSQIDTGEPEAGEGGSRMSRPQDLS